MSGFAREGLLRRLGRAFFGYSGAVPPTGLEPGSRPAAGLTVDDPEGRTWGGAAQSPQGRAMDHREPESDL